MRYTPLQIDQMRKLIQSADDIYDSAEIERRLLTHMANGTTVAELEEHKQQRDDERRRGEEWRRAEYEMVKRLCPHDLWWTPEQSDRTWSPQGTTVFLGVHQCRHCSQIDRRSADRRAVPLEEKRK